MFEHTPLWIVESDDDIPELVERLSRATVLGVDTESDSMYSYTEKVCLIQITDAEGDIIVDPLKIDDLSPLAPIFSNRDIVKIYHGADFDIVSLRRDFGFENKNMFDTLFAAQFLDLDRLGLADLIDTFFGIPIDKKFQRHDWSKRPLLPEHLDYARGDTHWLLALREILLRRLRKVGRVRHVKEECRILEKRKPKVKPFDPEGWLRIKRTGHLDDTAKRVLRQLYLFRDAQAKRQDRPTFKVIGDRLLVKIAEAQPTSRRELDDLFPRKRSMKRRYGKGIVAAVRDGLDDDSPLPTRPKRKKKKKKHDNYERRLHGGKADRVFDALKSWRNALCNDSDLHNPFSVANNSTLRRIAKARPLDMEELAALPGLRKWQVRDHGEAILAILDKHAPADRLDEDDGSSSGRSSGRRRRRRR